MEALKNYNLFVVAADNVFNNEVIKFRLKRHVNKNVKVQTFASRELCMDSIKRGISKPDVVVLYHRLNKRKDGDANSLHTMDAIKRISPKSSVIIVSEPEDMDNAVKALRHGAQDCILKDKFLFYNIGASVNRCLNPSKV